jgi:hypothetical protein
VIWRGRLLAGFDASQKQHPCSDSDVEYFAHASSKLIPLGIRHP